MPKAKVVLRMFPVVSDCVKAIGYQNSKKVLTVNMKKDDSTYAYLDVPYTKFLALCEAPSLGTFYRNEIMGKYDSDKISD